VPSAEIGVGEGVVDLLPTVPVVYSAAAAEGAHDPSVAVDE
jgi:hypothetical protein